MSAREWINNNSATVTIVAVVLLAFALVVILWTAAGNDGDPFGRDLYFVDLNSNEIFVGHSDQIPPIAAPSDSAGQTSGVRVTLASCGDCPSQLQGRSVDELGDEVFVAYFETYTEQARDALEEDTIDSPAAASEGHLIRGPEPTDDWVPIHSSAGLNVQNEFEQRCGGDELPTVCEP